MEIAQGSVIGNYRILRPLGKGGMGTVYEVEHVKLGVRYALKAFDVREGEAELFRTRFAAEGKILALLVHPNIERVIDLDFDEHISARFQITRPERNKVHLQTQVFEDGVHSFTEDIFETVHELEAVCGLLRRQGFRLERCAHRLLEDGVDVATWYIVARKE